MKNKTVKIVVIAVVCIILLFSVFTAGFFVGTGSTFFKEYFSDENYISAETSEIKIQEEIKSVNVEWVSGNVTVTRSEDDCLYIIEDGNARKSDALVYKIIGDTLEIEFKRSRFGIFGINADSSKNLTLKLPEKQYNTIDINSVSADVDIKNVNADKFDLETVSGEIEIAQSVFSNLEIESVSGNSDIYLPDSASFRAEVDTVSGDFSTDFAVTKRGESYICGNGDMLISADMVSGNLKICKQ